VGTTEKDQSGERNKKKGNKTRLILECLGLFILVSSLLVNGFLYRETSRSRDAAERSATAAEKSLDAAKLSADAAQRSARVAEVGLTATISQHFYLSQTPSYFDSKDKDDVWFLQPPMAIPIKLPPAEIIEKWQEKKNGWYFVWLACENTGPGYVSHLSLSLEGALEITYIAQSRISELGREPYYINPVELDGHLAPGQRALLLVGTLQALPSEMPKFEVYTLVDRAVKTWIQGTITYKDLSSDQEKTVPIGVTPGEVRHYFPWPMPYGPRLLPE